MYSSVTSQLSYAFLSDLMCRQLSSHPPSLHDPFSFFLQDKMDAFLSLFDPTLEDETPEHMDELNGNVVRDDTWRQHEERRGTVGGIRRGPSVAILPDQLPSEPQEGNIEYKLKLVNPNHERFKRLVSQVWAHLGFCGFYFSWLFFLSFTRLKVEEV